VDQVGGNVQFDYTVKLTNDGGTDSGWKVTGNIDVFNPNPTDSITLSGITDVITTDAAGTNPDTNVGNNDGACVVDTSGGLSVAPGDTFFPYTCTYSGAPAQKKEYNTATISWGDQTLPTDGHLAPGSTDFTVDFTFDDGATGNPTLVGNCITVTDTFNGQPADTLGTFCADGTDSNVSSNPAVTASYSAPTWTLTYSRSIPVPANDCKSYSNTATFTGAGVTSGLKGSDSTTVTVCGPAKTGALTIGFWKTTNGQNLIKTYCNNGGNNLGTYLAGLGGGAGPFSNAPTTCSSLATYVQGILSGASATNMNNMLKAQMLGTALDVWFSGPGWTNVKIGSVKPPSNFLSHNSLGTFSMDTTAICPMVDNTTAGTATCKNNTPSTNAFTTGALPAACMTIQAILDYEATAPSPFNGSTSSSVWYAGNRTLEEVAKNTFDQFNNQDAFGC